MNKRVRKVVWIVVAIPTLLFLLFQLYRQPWGYIAVEMACSESGGTEIASTVSVDSYYSGDGRLHCSHCFHDIGAGRFRAVDVFVGESREISGTPGYYRFELATATDARCDWWYRSSYSGSTQRIFGVDKQSCIALHPIDEATLSRYESTVTRYELIDGPFGIDLFKDEHVITDRKSGEVLGYQRNFKFLNSVSRSLGHTAPSWQCAAESADPFRPREFRVRVLVDEKERS